MRIFFTLFLLASILFLPYWVYLPLILIGIVLFPIYLEAIVLSLLVDVLYSNPAPFLQSFSLGIIASLLVLFAAPLRSYLRFNA